MFYYCLTVAKKSYNVNVKIKCKDQEHKSFIFEPIRKFKVLQNASSIINKLY